LSEYIAPAGTLITLTVGAANEMEVAAGLLLELGCAATETRTGSPIPHPGPSTAVIDDVVQVMGVMENSPEKPKATDKSTAGIDEGGKFAPFSVTTPPADVSGKGTSVMTASSCGARYEVTKSYDEYRGTPPWVMFHVYRTPQPATVRHVMVAESEATQPTAEKQVGEDNPVELEQ
jgi:hypothetical protein